MARSNQFDRRVFLSMGAIAAAGSAAFAAGTPFASGKKDDEIVAQSAPSGKGPKHTTTTEPAPTTTAPPTTTSTTSTTPATTTTAATTTTTVPLTTTTVDTTTTTPESTTTTTEPVAGSGPARWSDAATWGGSVPAAGTSVSIERPVLLDVDAVVHGLVIQPGGSLTFDAGSNRTLTSTSNVVVLGALHIRPSSPAVRHTLRFADIDESQFVGGGMQVLDTDVGLWCLGGGLLDVAGAAKVAWTRTAGGVPAGATSITLAADPVGWRVGDELAITPTVSPGQSNHHDAYDYATVTAISGRTVSLSKPTTHAHPSIDVGRGMLVAPEVLNLTRNVAIEGTQDGRAHIFVMPVRPQQLAYFSARWMGPRQPDGSYTKSVLGRYGLHFHMGGDATRGSHIVGGVVRDTGSHAFVAHESNGVTFTSCISHNTIDEAFWWDPRAHIGATPPKTHDATYVACVASRVRCDPSFRGYTLGGFELGAGTGNRATDCVAVGVQGNKNAAGFLWPEGANGVWDFQRCVSHNNKVHGMFTWQNTDRPHVVENFVCYHNGGAGCSHGAYRNGYKYINGFLYGNRVGGILLHATSRSDIIQQFVRLHCECAGLSDHAINVTKHTLDPLHPTEVVGCTFNGQRKQAVGMTYTGSNGATTPERLNLVECTSSTPILGFNDTTMAGTLVRVQSGGTSVHATINGTPGTYNAAWNAVINPAPRFSDEPPSQVTHTFPLLQSAP